MSKSLKKILEKIKPPPYLETTLPAFSATAAPPLGTQISERNLQIAIFVKDFNERTKNYAKNVPIPIRLWVKPDRTYNMVLYTPTVGYFVLQAAGIDKGAKKPGHEIAGIITLKHVYEIAKIKINDPCWKCKSLENVCKSIIGVCHSMGVKVVKNISDQDLVQFHVERSQVVALQQAQAMEEKEAKLARALVK